MLLKAHRSANAVAYRGGFSLLELLVVTSVITLLVAILSPSLSDARARAKQVVCSSRMRQWGVALACYATENDGMWPHCDGLDRGPDELDDPGLTKEGLADWHGWADLLPPMIDLKPRRDYPRFNHPGESTFYQCPSGRPFESNGVYSYRPFRDGFYSYAMNSCLELDSNAWPPADGLGYPMPSFLDTALIRCPQRTFVLFDQLMDPRKGFDAKRVYRGAGKYSGSYPKSFSARHRHGQSGLGGNILYADGHIQWQRKVWKDDWDVELEVPPRDDVNWYPYPVVKRPEKKQRKRTRGGGRGGRPR